MKRILSPHGTITDRCALEALHLDASRVLDLYQGMVRTRCFTEKATAEGHLKRMPIYISPKGQEAAEVASALALGPDDWAFWYARSQGVAFARGVSYAAMFQLFYGVPAADVVQQFLAHKVMLPYILVGPHLPHAVGFAMGQKMDRLPAVAVAYFGDGATARGYFHSALNWASIFRLPVVFVCENNGIAVSTPLCRQTATATLAEKASAYGMVGEVIDGNDAFAVYGAMQSALERARMHGVPTLLDAVTARMETHTTALGVEPPRSAAEQEHLHSHDPLRRLQRFLLSEAAGEIYGISWSDEDDACLHAQAVEEMQQAARVYEGLSTYDGRCLVATSVAFHGAPQTAAPYRTPHPRRPFLTPR